MKREWRAVITCTVNPCRYCMAPAKSEVVGALTRQPAFATEGDAMAYGMAMNHNVYGASAHRVSTQSRVVGEWGPALDENVT